VVFKQSSCRIDCADRVCDDMQSFAGMGSITCELVLRRNRLMRGLMDEEHISLDVAVPCRFV
jgi:hypothetical protein